MSAVHETVAAAIFEMSPSQQLRVAADMIEDGDPALVELGCVIARMAIARLAPAGVSG